MAPCGITEVAGVITAVSQNEHDYWPNTLYDAREASIATRPRRPLQILR